MEKCERVDKCRTRGILLTISQIGDATKLFKLI